MNELTVRIPKELTKKIYEYTNREGLDPNEFIISLLKQVVLRIEREEEDALAVNGVEKDLKDMGYLK